MPSVALALPDTQELRKHCEQRLLRLIEVRRPWLEFCQNVAEELLPNRLPYLLNPHDLTQRAGEQNTHIVDAVGHLALDTAAAGISSGSMPPTSPWFGLQVRGQFGQDDDQRFYLEESAGRLLQLHNSSNANHVFPEAQKEWLAFGTGAVLLLEDAEDGYRIDHMTIGEYYIAEDRRGRVDTCYRQMTMTVGQLVDEFGIDALSPGVRDNAEKELWDVPIAVVHAIEPDRDGKNPEGDNPDLPWRSVYYEANSDHNQVLAVRGFNRFPALVWRWGKLPGSAYGYGRGHDVLPHLVRLRKMIYRFGQAVAFKAEPPMQLPPGIQQHEVRALPGGKTSILGSPIQNLMKVEIELAELAQEIERTRQDIRDTIGATLVASLRRIDHQITAREADLRTSQDLTEWLPALFRLNEELLDPYIQWMWQIAEERRELPEMPRSLDQATVDIEFTSPLARKQRQAEADAIVRTFAVAGEMAKVTPEVVDNLDADAAIRRIAQIEGTPAGMLVPIERVRALRAARAQQQQAAARAQAAQVGVDLARGAAEADRIQESAA